MSFCDRGHHRDFTEIEGPHGKYWLHKCCGKRSAVRNAFGGKLPTKAQLAKAEEGLV